MAGTTGSGGTMASGTGGTKSGTGGTMSQTDGSMDDPDSGMPQSKPDATTPKPDATMSQPDTGMMMDSGGGMMTGPDCTYPFTPSNFDPAGLDHSPDVSVTANVTIDTSACSADPCGGASTFRN